MTVTDATSPTSQPGQPGKRWVNYDAVLPQTIDVTRGGRTLHLRDDVPWDALIYVFDLLELQEQGKGDDLRTASEMRAWYAQMRALTTQIAGACVRHSYPEMSDEDVGAWLTFEQQLQLVMLFFQLRSQAFSLPSSALTNDSDTTASSADSADSALGRPATRRPRSATANRAQRRSERSAGSRGATSPRKR